MVDHNDDRPIYPLPPGVNTVDDDGNPICHACGCTDFEVTHVGNWTRGEKRRRHKCKNCGLPYRSIQLWGVDE